MFSIPPPEKHSMSWNENKIKQVTEDTWHMVYNVFCKIVLKLTQQLQL